MIDPDVGRRPQRTVCPEKGASKLRTGRPARKLDGKLFQSGGADAHIHEMLLHIVSRRSRSEGFVTHGL
jgi:hypothetical protein